MIYNFKNSHSSSVNFNLKERFNTLFYLTKTKNIEDFNSFLLNITKEVKLENDFNKLGIDINSSISKILTDINDQRLSNNPVTLDKEIIKNLLIKG